MKRAQNKSNIQIVKDYLSGTRPFTSVGWTGDMVERKDNETWVDGHGATWIQKNGRKKRINKVCKISADDVRQRCKKCNMDMKWGNRFDDKIFNKTGYCYDCNVEVESLLKHQGKFKNYELRKVFKNQKGAVMSFKAKVEETIHHLETTGNDIVYINEDGSKEVWPDTTKNQVLADAREDLKECDLALERIEESLRSLESEK